MVHYMMRYTDVENMDIHHKLQYIYSTLLFDLT